MHIVESLHAALGGPEALWLLITSLGSDSGFIVLLGLYLFLVRAPNKRDLGVWFALSFVVNALLKQVWQLPRPYDVQPGIASQAAIATAGGPGLPSGHAQVSATFWGMAAYTLRSRAFWVVAVIMVLLIALSRMVLGVHFPSDVLAGLLLGALFVVLAVRVRLPAPNVWVPLACLVVAAVFPPISAGLGLLAGFWLSKVDFEVPRNFWLRLPVALVGLVLVFAVFFAFRLVPEGLRHLGLVNALRYGLLVLTATELVPRLLRLRRAAPPMTAQAA